MTASMSTRTWGTWAAATLAAAVGFLAVPAWGQAPAPLAQSRVAATPPPQYAPPEALSPRADLTQLDPAEIDLLAKTLADADSHGLESGDFGAAAFTTPSSCSP